MAMEKRSAQTGRKAWADVCRCVAMLGVIVIHAGAPAFYQFGKLAPLDWWAVNFLDAFSRPAVPLFVMLSGALLLRRDGAPVTLAEVFRRVLKIGVPLVAWSVFYVLWTAGFTVDAAALRAIVRGPVMYHLWFCYMILGLYLLLPLLQALFQAAGMACELTEDADALLWAKLLVNAAINPLGALLRVPNGALAESADARALMAQVLAEAQAVARALGVALPEGAALERVLGVCQRTAANRCSMLQDVQRGRVTEIDAINGAIARLGAEKGVSAPLNAALAQLVRAAHSTAKNALF